ncbi:hypothetical protein JHK86_004455 [Glycine max]|nr:hypothetical protein JHK86_004455 [Glycine max]
MLGAALVAKKACELGLQYNSKDIPVRLLYEPQPRPRAIAALVGEAIVKVACGTNHTSVLSCCLMVHRYLTDQLAKVEIVNEANKEEVVSFPLYVKARRFAFHKENMILTIVYVVTLTIYHFGDECVNMYITSVPHTDYFSNLVSFFKNQCMDLNRLISETLNQEPEDDNIAKCNAGCLTVNVPNSSSSSGLDPKSVMSKDNCSSSNLAISICELAMPAQTIIPIVVVE